MGLSRAFTWPFAQQRSTADGIDRGTAVRAVDGQTGLGLDGWDRRADRRVQLPASHLQPPPSATEWSGWWLSCLRGKLSLSTSLDE
jgi:hypothetical protein